MKKLILAVIPLALAACGGGGSDAPATQAYNVTCTTAPATVNCQAQPANSGTTTGSSGVSSGTR